MQIVNEYQSLIEDKLKEVQFPDCPKNLYDPLRYFLQLGGKHTRPYLTMLGCSLFGKSGSQSINAAIAVELFHNFTLIHDDIMDNAPLRRGQQTVHEKWNRDVAILSGDVLFSEAYIYISKHDAPLLPDLLSVLSHTAKQVCEGQQMDMDFESSDSVTIEEYLEMIRLKTSVLLGAALKIGAIVAEVKNQQDIDNIYAFGVNIGLAFQMQDDILDVYGDPEKFGKQIGGDILSNKKTFLLLKAYELADETTKAELDKQLQNKNNQEKIQNVKNIFDQLEVRTAAEKQKSLYYENARNNLALINVPEENKEELKRFAKDLMLREF